MKRTLLIALFVLITMTTVPAQEQADCSDLFFSEYVEGSGNNKALEIFNPTDKIIDLSYYWVVRYSNGASDFSSGGSTHLEGFLPPHKVFILVNGQTEDNQYSPACDPALQELAGKYPSLMDHEYPAPTYMNGNDAIGLLKSEDNTTLTNPVAVDLFGQIGLGAKIHDEYGWSNVKDSLVSYHYRVVNGEDTTWVETAGRVTDYIVQHTDTAGKAPFGPYWMAWTKDHTLIRRPEVTKGVTANPDTFKVVMEWDTLPGGKDVWDNLGKHTCNCGSTGVRKMENAMSDIYIYPNPVTYHTFEILSETPIRQAMVTNLLGQKVLLSDPPGTGDTRIRITLPQNTPPGLYLVRVETGNNKFIVRKILVK
jgi:hypothetical protein